jgi:PAS domain-containing protein
MHSIKTRKLRLILENISEGIIMHNDKKIILANYIANEMLEFKRAMKCLIDGSF